MGWKLSLIIIDNPEGFQDDASILQAIGKEAYTLEKETSLEACLYPNDKSISIGSYNGNVIIADDYQLTTQALEKSHGLHLTQEEKGIFALFPRSEIVTLACHSVVNYHGYSLIEQGEKKRIKIISSDTAKIEWGLRTAEEESIYSLSHQREGELVWASESDPDDPFKEDQMMEEFTFALAKRRLGVFLDQDEGEELLETVLFKKYMKPKESSIFDFLKSLFD